MSQNVLWPGSKVEEQVEKLSSNFDFGMSVSRIKIFIITFSKNLT